MKFKELVELYDVDKNRLIKTTTKESNSHIYKILSELHDIDCSDFERIFVINYLEEKLVKNKVSYVNKMLKYLKKVFAWGTKAEVIDRNIFKAISYFKSPDEVVEAQNYYTPEEFEIWEDEAKRHIRNNPSDYPYYVYICCMYYMGMRTGEVRALTFIDIEGTHIRINKTCSRIRRKEGTSFIVTPPKSKNSNRKIEMPKKLQDILGSYINYIKECGQYSRNSYLFGISSPLVPQTIAIKFKKICDAAGLPQYRPYALRHSHATLLINNGALDFAVAARLGHTVEELRRTYVHLFNTSEENCITILNQIHPSNLSFNTDHESLAINLERTIMQHISKRDLNKIKWSFFYTLEHPKNQIDFWGYNSNHYEQKVSLSKEQFQKIKGTLIDDY